MGIISLFLENIVFEKQWLCFQLEAHLMHLREIWSLWNILWQSSALSNWKNVGWWHQEINLQRGVWNLQTFFKVLWRGVEATKWRENDMHFTACIIFCSSHFPALSFIALFIIFKENNIMPCGHAYKRKPSVYDACLWWSNASWKTSFFQDYSL